MRFKLPILRSANVMFICREHPGNLIVQVRQRGFSVSVLPAATEAFINNEIPVESQSNYVAWLGADWAADAEQTKVGIGETMVDWLIVDHYAIDSRWEKKIRPHTGKIMVIDDLANRQHDCDLLLDQNLYHAMETRYNNLVPGNCKKLLGPRYALLRPQFATVRKNLCRHDGQVRRVLVFFGGVDSTNETEKTLLALVKITDRQFEVDVVVGTENRKKAQIQEFCTANEGFCYHCQVDNMAALMAKSDLAIGAGGTATWERCAVGVPSIIIAVADNQKELAETAAQNELLFYLGEGNAVSSERLLNTLIFSLSVPQTLQCYSENSLRTVDARGANRAANLLFPPQISIRHASIEDCESVYEWRNTEDTRRYIFNTEQIPFEIHRNWYFKTLENENRILLIGEICNKPVGVLRYDFTDCEALISIYLVPGVQGQGVGSQLIYCGSKWIRDNYPQIKVITAEIVKENIASVRAFETAGYKEHHLTLQEMF